MLRTNLLCFALLGVALAGCIGEEEGPITDDGGMPPLFTLAGLESRGPPLLYEGKRLIGENAAITNSYPPFLPAPESPPCAGENCEVIPLVVHGLGDQVLAVALEWETQDETWAASGGPGYYLGDAAVHLDAVIKRDGVVVGDVVETFHYGGVGILKDVEPGEYEIEVVAVKGHTTYYVSVAVQEPDALLGRAVTGELLPDLVAIPPDHPTFQVPVGHEAGTHEIALAGCGPDELVEDQDLRCLRFAGIIGNQGAGDFLTVLDFGDAEQAMVGKEARWQQVIKSVDGTERRVPIGAADYHEVHGHFHILDFVATQLYTYDLEGETRGEPVGDGRKMGFCVIDGGIIDLLGLLVPPKFDGGGCCYIAGICQMDMLAYDEFQMGMSPNWYDIYPWWRSDQYVEVSGLPDGVYELVTVINPDGLIIEADPDNNEASSVLRITGTDVEVLSMKTQAKLGPHPDADWGYAAQRAAADSG